MYKPIESFKAYLRVHFILGEVAIIKKELLPPDCRKCPDLKVVQLVGAEVHLCNSPKGKCPVYS